MERPAVLIVEPDEPSRHELGRGLAQLGYEAVPAVSLEEGLRFAEGLGPSVIVAAAELPEMADAESLDRLARASGPGSLVLLGSPRGHETEVPDDVRWIPTEGSNGRVTDATLHKLRLVLLGREMGIEPDPSLEALVGDLALDPPLELIRKLGRVGFTGRLVVNHGVVGFHDGEVLAARARNSRGVKAFCRIGRLLEGPFRVWPDAEPPVSPHSREMTEAVDELVLLAVEDAAKGEVPPRRTRVRVEVGPELFQGHFSSRQQALLTAAHQGITVGKLVDELPARDGDLVEDLRALEKRGLVVLEEPESRVQVVTDSTADLPSEITRRLGIEVVPLAVLFGERRFLDGEELRPREFYELLETDPEHPSTEPPPPAAFDQCYQGFVGERNGISLHISSKLSETWKHAGQAARHSLDSLPRERDDGEPVDLPVVDTGQASLGLGLLAVYAARMALRGVPAGEIAERCRAMSSRFQTLFVVDTLEYLQRGGRIGKARAWIGKLLRIKPILGIEDGQVVPVDRVRGGRAAHPRILELLGERLERGRPVMGGVAHAKAPVWAERLTRLLEEHHSPRELLHTEIGPVVGTHAGPGTVGCAVFQPTDEELALIAPIEERDEAPGPTSTAG